MKNFVIVLLIWSLGAAGACSAQSQKLDKMRLPPGFKISIYAASVPGARSLALGSNGTVFVGTRDEGKVYALPNRNEKNTADEVITIAGGLNMPNGVAYREGSLYVAELNRI